MSWRVLSVIVALAFVMPLSAESEFDRYVRKQRNEYTEYMEVRDRAFSSFLKRQWEEFRIHSGLVRDGTPKPVDPPIAPVKEPERPVKRPPPMPPKPLSRPKRAPAPGPLPGPPRTGERLFVRFLGHELALAYDPALRQRLEGRMSEGSIADYWKGLSSAHSKSLLEQLDGLRAALELNDWGFVQLVRTVAGAMHPDQVNEQVLLSWFLLAKDGYRARVGYSRDGLIHLFLPAEQKIYETPYLVFDKERHYVVRARRENGSLGSLFTYEGSYPGAERRLDMALSKMPKTYPTLKERSLEFKFRGKRYDVTAVYDNNAVAFLDSYPQLDLKWYFQSDVDPVTGDLPAQLRPLVEGRDKVEAVNMLLRFAQTAFSYKTDREQFGYENYFFVAESLRFPYSDCEDRSIIFAWLVRELLGMEVVGLGYPGHVATAVRFDDNVEGDSIAYGGKRFVVADPTFINAKVGMTMPRFAAHMPNVISID